MARFFSMLVLFSLVFTSCVTTKAMPEDKITAIVGKYLENPSQMEALELTLLTDYPRNRITLDRSYSINQKGGSEASPDSMLGIYLGNGLFFDNNRNLAIRLDRLLDVDEKNIKSTVLHGYTTGGIPTVQTTTYGNGFIEINSLLSG